MNIAIQRPLNITTDINASRFGVSTDSPDNTAAMQSAFDCCREHPGSRLVVDYGVYRFNTKENILIDGLKDVIISANYSEFIFFGGGFFRVQNCERLLIKDLVIDWDWGKRRLADLYRIEAVDTDKHFFDASNLDTGKVTDEQPWLYTTPYDRLTQTPGCEAKREYAATYVTYLDPSPHVQKMEKVDDNRLRLYHDGVFDDMEPGDLQLVRYVMYGSNAFYVMKSGHVTLQNITVFSVPGMAFYFGDSAHHFHLQNCTVMVRPNSQRSISASADAVHIADTCGHILIEGCDLSFMGDDCINIGESLGYVIEKTGARSLRIQGDRPFEIGDEYAFKRTDYSDMDFTARVAGSAEHDGRQRTLEFDADLPDEVGKATIIYNKKYHSDNYHIRDNYFHENRGRGMLLQCDNGLVEHNRFYKTLAGAINIVSDIQPGLWAEGSGVDTLEVRHNSFKDCNVNDWSALIMMDVHNPDSSGSVPAFRSIYVHHNRFYDFPSRAFEVRYADGMTISDNVFMNPTARQKEKPDRGHISVDRSVNVYIKNNTWFDTGLSEPDALFSVENSEGVEISGNQIRD